MNDKILHQIEQISVRISDLNDRIDTTISSSEIKKIEKTKKKLVKEKSKLYKKLYSEKEEQNGTN